MEEYLHLTKGDVSGAYWLVMTDAVQRRRADEVYAGLATVRSPTMRLGVGPENRALGAAQEALAGTEHIVGTPLRLVIVEKLSDDHVLFGVLASDTGQFKYEITEGFAPSARSLGGLLHQPFEDEESLKRGVDLDQVVEMGEHLWSCIPEFVRHALVPRGKHEVLLCGDSDSLDLPWEAMRIGANENDWLGLHRHLARLPYLSEQIILGLRPEDCGAGSRSAAIACPWDVPGQELLNEAEAEAMEVAQLLGQAGYEFVPGGEPLMGRSADMEAIQSVLLASPTVVHFAGHGGIVRNEGVLVLWDPNNRRCCDALFGRRTMAESKQKSSRPVLFTSRPLIVLNACWAGRSRDFGGQREDLAAAFLDEGAGCVIAWPTPVHDEVGRILATLLYVPSMQDQRGLAFTFQKVRSLVERKCRGKSHWWIWFWMRYQGNPYARLPLAARGADIPALRDQRIPRAIELVRDLIPNWRADR